MKHCDKCGVSVTGPDRRYCPLCHQSLRDDLLETRDVFPFIPTIYRQYHFFLRLLLFLSVACGIVLITINILIPQSGPWSLFVAAGIIAVWVSVAFAMGKRGNIPKNILYQVFILSVLFVLWDILIGWQGWSLAYALPIVCMSAMATMAILAKVMHLSLGDHLIYFVLDSVFGIIPLIFVLTGTVEFIYLSLICVAVSVISLAALLIFDGKRMLSELKRRLHL